MSTRESTFAAAFGVAILCVVVDGCSTEESERVTARIGGVALSAALEPDPPREAGNVLLIALTDANANGAPVDGAEIAVTAVMPPMGPMSEMRSVARVQNTGGGRYRASFDLPMAGTWTLDVSVKSPAGSGSAQLRLTVGAKGLAMVGASEGAARLAPTGAAPPAGSTRAASTMTVAFSPGSLAKLRAAFDAYERARGILARDTLEGVKAAANDVAAPLRELVAADRAIGADVRACIEAAASDADALARASTTDIGDARRRFGELSRDLMALGSADARLQQGWHAFECPMTDGFNRWFQRSAQIENPYMGKAMPACGTQSSWDVSAPSTSTAAHADGPGDDIAYYTCSMHPSVKSAAPGTCPICNMALTPVTERDLESGTVAVDAVRRQQLGIKTARVEKRPLTLDINAVARITYDEAGLHDVSLKIGGWVEKLLVDQPGQRVKAGQTLFTLYSSELYAAQIEFLAAQRATQESGAGISETLGRAARKRLELWNLTPQQIDALVASGEAQRSVPILAPADGYVIEKDVVAGAKIDAGARVYRIANLSRVWIEAELFESDLAQVKVGQPATITLPYAPGARYEGKVSFIYPYLDDASRTGRARIELANPKLELKPNMFANVELKSPRGEALQVPSEAVIYTGRRRLVFIDLGEGRLQPQQIEVGIEGREWTEVKQGLAAGDVVVTSGNFLIAAESRIRSAARFWHDDESVGAPPPPPPPDGGSR